MHNCPACQQKSISMAKILLVWGNKVECPECRVSVGAKHSWVWVTVFILTLMAGEFSVLLVQLPEQTKLRLLLLVLASSVVAYMLVFSLFARLEIKKVGERDEVYLTFVYGVLVGVLLCVAFLSGTITGFYLHGKNPIATGNDRFYVGESINNELDTGSLRRREIYLSGYISENNYRYIPLAIRRLDEIDSTKPITLLINSNGGDLGAAYAIVNEMRHSKARVKTIATAYCGSAALVVFIHGTGGRCAYGNTKFFFHTDGFIDGNGKVDDTLGLSIFRESHRTVRLPTEWFRVATSRWFGADEAKHYGLVDSIL